MSKSNIQQELLIEQFLKKIASNSKNDLSQSQLKETDDAYTSLIIQCINRSRKYFLTSSSLQLINKQLPSYNTPLIIDNFPDTHVWVEFEKGISPRRETGGVHGVFFFLPSKEQLYFNELTKTTVNRSPHFMQKVNLVPGEWTLNTIDSSGKIRSGYGYNPKTSSWKFPSGYICPYALCKQNTHDLCDRCARALDNWQAWFVTALQTIQGEYAQKNLKERTTIQDLAIKNIENIYNYHFVNLDVSTTNTYFKVESSEKENKISSNSSWLEDALTVNPDGIEYLEHTIAQGTRILDPERNSRWKEKRIVTVKKHVKSIPIKTQNLKKRISKVKASEYENKDKNTT